MRQSSLTGFEKYAKKTRKELFLEEMERIIPRSQLTQALAPYYPNPTGPGRRPKGLERMLRIYFMQIYFPRAVYGSPFYGELYLPAWTNV